MGRARSNKTKGKNGQNEVCELLLKKFETLEPDDARSNPMGNPGEDVLLSPAGRRAFPYQIEVKRKQKFSICRALEQCRGHGVHTPIVFFREDKLQSKDTPPDQGKWYVCLLADDLIHLEKLRLWSK